jgi:cytosine deaminase
MTDGNLLVKDVRPMGGPITDVLIRDGRITSVEVGLQAPGDAPPAIDGGGDLVLPGLVDAHAHLDKTL